MPATAGLTGEWAEPRFRAPDQAVPQDWPKLATHLAGHGHHLDTTQGPRQFAGGFGNLNYLLTIDGAPWVLRRPPLGPIPPGANDMAREHLVLTRLSPRLPLVPKPLHFSADIAVLGAPFLIMEYRPGLVIGGDLPDGLDSSAVGPALSEQLVRFLADLHAIPPASVGLETFAKPDGFLARAVAGWTKRAAIALDGAEPKALGEIVSWLRERPVPVGAVTLLHNDFKLDNLVLDPATLAPVAVLDWDMGSRGDPLFDVGTTLSYWTEPGDPPCMHRIHQMPTARPGFWTRQQALAHYARLTGRDVTQFKFYRVLTLFKLAVVFLQIDARKRTGGPVDARLASLAGVGEELLEFTVDAIRRQDT